VVARSVAGDGYRATVGYMADGSVKIRLVRASGGTRVTLASAVIPQLRLATGAVTRVRFEVRGVGPVSLRAKLWTVGDSEPADWQVVALDTAPAAPATGSIAITGTLSQRTSEPATLVVDNLIVQAPR
jgi:hypothetical protein